jgi:metallo-beta-lactamase family protein
VPEARVVLDAPMGGRMTDLYRRFPETLRPELARRGSPPATTRSSRPGSTVVRTGAASRALNGRPRRDHRRGRGMMTGGRILHHLRTTSGTRATAWSSWASRPRGPSAGASSTARGRVRVLGETVAVAAEVHTINGFSAHADAPALDAWWTASEAEVVVPVHGEAGARRAGAAGGGGGRRPRAARLGVDLHL